MFQVALDDDFFNTVPLIEVNNQRDGLPFESINIVSGIGNFVLTLLFFLQIARHKVVAEEVEDITSGMENTGGRRDKFNDLMEDEANGGGMVNFGEQGAIAGAFNVSSSLCLFNLAAFCLARCSSSIRCCCLRE